MSPRFLSLKFLLSLTASIISRLCRFVYARSTGMLHKAERFSERKVSRQIPRNSGRARHLPDDPKEIRLAIRFRRIWGERRDLNPRPSVPQTDALPAELRSPAWSNDNTRMRTAKDHANRGP